jgi:hypothetical protein
MYIFVVSILNSIILCYATAAVTLKVYDWHEVDVTCPL